LELVVDKKRELRAHFFGELSTEQPARCNHLARGVGSERVEDPHDVVGILELVTAHDRVGLETQP
jgi:hypothetical protein